MEWCDPDGYCMVALRLNARHGKTDLRWFTDISNRLCWLHDVEICIYRWYWSELWKQASEMLLFNSHPPRPSHPLPHLKAASGGLIARHDHSESFKLETRSYVEQLQLPCQAPCITLLPSRATMVAKVVNYRKKPLSLSLYIYALYMQSIPHIFPTCFSWQKIHQYFWILLTFCKWHPYSAVTR